VRHSCARRWHQLVLFSSGKASLEVFGSGLAGPLLAGARAMATRAEAGPGPVAQQLLLAILLSMQASSCMRWCGCHTAQQLRPRW